MHEQKLLKISIPPFVTIFFVFLALIFNRAASIVYQFVIDSDNLLKNIVIVLLAIPTFIMALGFLISSFSCAVLSLLSTVGSRIKKINFRFLNPNWKGQAKKVLQKRYSFKNSDINKSGGEAAEWLIQAQFSDNVCDHIGRRWEMFWLNVNSAIAIVIALFFIIFFKIFSWWPFFIVWCVTFVIFIVNACLSWQSIREIDHFLLDNLENIQSNKPEQSIPEVN